MKFGSILLIITTLIALICVTEASKPIPIRRSNVIINEKRAVKGVGTTTAPPSTAGEGGEQEEKDDKEVSDSVKLQPNADGVKLLTSLVKTYVDMVKSFRTVQEQLPDPLERILKDISEKLEKLQDEVNVDTDIDLGNILNSGGKK